MPAYTVTATDTVNANVTMVGITAATTRRGRIYELWISSANSPPADQTADYSLKRYTAAGTSTPFTPNPTDPAEPAALLSAGYNHSVEPTYTANSDLLRIAVHQKFTMRWYGAPGREFVIPAASGNGIGLLINSASTPFPGLFTIHFCE